MRGLDGRLCLAVIRRCNGFHGKLLLKAFREVSMSRWPTVRRKGCTDALHDPVQLLWRHTVELRDVVLRGCHAEQHGPVCFAGFAAKRESDANNCARGDTNRLRDTKRFAWVAAVDGTRTFLNEVRVDLHRFKGIGELLGLASIVRAVLGLHARRTVHLKLDKFERQFGHHDVAKLTVRRERLVLGMHPGIDPVCASDRHASVLFS